MLSGFNKFTKEEGLISGKGRVLAAVSGGVDSVVMCRLLYEAKIPFAIAHCNFQLRGKESDGDEDFVEALAEQYDVPFHCISFDTEQVAAKEKSSVQITARELRYDWFRQLKKENRYSCIATAHHRDDSIETVFINLIRGTGISGLHGILPKQGDIIRPLLFAGKEAILKYARKSGIIFREDSSNASERYVRNKIRRRMMPLLKEMNPDIENTLAANIKRFHDAELIFRSAIEDMRKKIVIEKAGVARISIAELKKLPAPATCLYHFLEDYNFSAAVAEDIHRSFDSQSGTVFFSSTHQVLKDRGQLLITPVEKKKEEKREQITIKTRTKKNSEFRLNIKTLNKSELKEIPKDKNIACLDYEKLEFPLEIRSWEKGDFFYPLGMKGKKLLSDYFIDRKFSLLQKEKVRLLVSGSEIVWIIGERPDNRYKITENTRKIYFVTVDFQLTL
jgi:tRNA(Ile)-lysidine synthase